MKNIRKWAVRLLIAHVVAVFFLPLGLLLFTAAISIIVLVKELAAQEIADNMVNEREGKKS